MKDKGWQYFEPDIRSITGYRWYICKDKLKTYPHALRFKSQADANIYFKAKRDFIQSTKIPESCKKCPIYDTAFMCNGHCGTVLCHLAWRKIWEYVK